MNKQQNNGKNLWNKKKILNNKKLRNIQIGKILDGFNSSINL